MKKLKQLYLISVIIIISILIQTSLLIPRYIENIIYQYKEIWSYLEK